MAPHITFTRSIKSRITAKMTAVGLKRILDRYFVNITSSIFRVVWKKSVDIDHIYFKANPQQTQGGLSNELVALVDLDEDEAKSDFGDQEDISESAVEVPTEEDWLQPLRHVVSEDDEPLVFLENLEDMEGDPDQTDTICIQQVSAQNSMYCLKVDSQVRQVQQTVKFSCHSTGNVRKSWRGK